METARNKAQRIIAGALAMFCLHVDGAPANTDDAVTRANHGAYDAAMKCFVADGLIAGRKQKAGEKALQTAFESKAREAFDVAMKLGDSLGYSGNRINQDFGLAQTEELPKLVTDDAHLQRVMGTCKALGLM